MAGGRRILAFPFHDWRKSQAEGFRTRDAHLLQAFARRPDVEAILVVDRPSSGAERWLRRVPSRPVGELVAEWREGSARVTVTAVAPKTEVLDIGVPDLLAPIRRQRGWWFDVFARREVGAAIDRALAERLGSPTDAVAWVPAVAPVLFRSGARVAFDSLDNWIIHPVLRRHASEAGAAYESILPRADAVFVSGPASARALGRWRPEIPVLPNGVDPAVFAAGGMRPADLPTGLIVGYAGKLAQRIDDQLVVAVADALPDVAFVFVGPVLSRVAVRAMRARPNVHVLGDRQYKDLPAYLHAFDVAWIPHRVGEGETGGDPIKLYEYWAAGRQVVSTRIDGMDAWAEQVHFVDNASHAGMAIRGLLNGVVAPLPTTIPPGRTWDEIAAVLLGD